MPDGDGGWRLRGVKRWNGSGWAGVVSVFARQVDASGRLGHATGFVVRQGMPGLRVGPESLTMGVRSIMQNSIYFDDVAVGRFTSWARWARGWMSPMRPCWSPGCAWVR